MKRVLILSHRQHFCEGGTENYAYNLIKILKQNSFNIDELCLHNAKKFKSREPIEGVKIITLFNEKCKNIFSYIFLLWKAKIILKKTLIHNSYDLVIYNSTIFPYVKLCKKYYDKSIYILHTDPNKIFGKWKSFLKKCLFIKNGYYCSKNIVIYLSELKKNMPNYERKIFYDVKLFVDLDNENMTVKKGKNIEKSIYFIGRNSNEKRIDLINEISKNLDKKIHSVGYVNNNFLHRYNSIIFDGHKNKNEIYQQILPNASALILMSDYEGFSFVCAEALWFGVPLILRNTFPSASFLINKGRNGILLDKKINIEEATEKIKKTNFKCFNKNEIKKFSRRYFSIDIFIKKWTRIISEVSSSEK